MQMTRFLTLLLFVMSLPTAFSQAIEERMAVLELKNKAGFSREEVEYLSSLLRRLASSELSQSFIVYDKENIRELLPPDVSLEDCVGQCAIETGRNINATYIITGTIIRFGKNLRISIDLHDTRSGRLIGSEVASGKEINDMESGIQEAGGRLLRKLMKVPKTYSKSKSTRKVIGETNTTLVGRSNKRVIATLLSQPRGAAVMIDGVQKCSEGKEVCKVELTVGAHQLSMTKTDYFVRNGSVSINEADAEIEWSLDPNFATLRVITVPSSLQFTINGEEHQGSFSQRITPKREYKVISSDPCYARKGEAISAGKPGEEMVVRLIPHQLQAIIDVSAKSPRGEPLKALISVDGNELGTTPSQHRVSICSKSLKLKHHEHGEYESSLSLNNGESKTFSVVINNSLLVRYERGLMWKKVGFFGLTGLTVFSAIMSIKYGFKWDARETEIGCSFLVSGQECDNLCNDDPDCSSAATNTTMFVFIGGFSALGLIGWLVSCTKGDSACPFSTEEARQRFVSDKNDQYIPSPSPPAELDEDFEEIEEL